MRASEIHPVRSDSAKVARRWYRRKRWIIPLGAMSVLLLCVALIAIYFITLMLHPLGKPGRHAAEMEAILLSPQPTGANARELVRRAAELATPIHDRLTAELQAVESRSRLPGLMFDVRADEHEPQVLEANDRLCRQAIVEFEAAGVWALLDRAAATQRSEPILDHSTFYITQPMNWLRPVRMVGVANRFRAQIALQRGDVMAYVKAVDGGLAIGRALAPDVSMLAELYAIATDELIIEQLRSDLVRHRFVDATLIDLLAILDRQRRSTLLASIRAEGVCTLDAIEAAYSDDGRGNGYLRALGFRHPRSVTVSGGLTEVTKRLPAIHLPDKREVSKAIRQFNHAMQQAIEGGQSAQKIAKISRDLINRADAHSVYILDPLCASRALGIGSGLAMEATRDGTRLMIALERHRLRHGQYPASLAALAPKFIDNVPIDPFTARPFRYRLLDAAATNAAEGYILYSIGFDEIDNGGTTAEDPYDAFSPKGPGTDFIINRAD
jgi:hypothetical protein